jgi:hypothetical protein
MTSRQSSNIYFVRSNESPIKYGWPWLLISFFLGWWGIPWGPIYTTQAIFRSFSGKDVTLEVLQNLKSQQAAQYAAENPVQGWGNFNSQQSN